MYANQVFGLPSAWCASVCSATPIVLPIHPTTTGSKLGANSWPHQRHDCWLHLIHEFGTKDIAFISSKWKVIMIPGENFWSIWRSGLMMRCSDTSISNISDEALPLVSVFLWGIPSHPIAGSPGREPRQVGCHSRARLVPKPHIWVSAAMRICTRPHTRPSSWSSTPRPIWS